MRSGRPRAAPEATRRRAEQVANAFVEFEATVLQGTIHRRICALATGAPLACVEACVYTRAASSAFPRALPLRQPSQYTMGYGLWAMGYACLVREASYPRTRAISMAYGRGLCSRYCLWSIDAPSLCAGAGGGAALGGKVDV